MEFYVPEVKSSDVTTGFIAERAMGKLDYNSRRETELFPRMIFYNRVGKCGSRSVLRLKGFQSAEYKITASTQLIANLWKEQLIWSKIMKQLLLVRTRYTPLLMKPISFEKCRI